MEPLQRPGEGTKGGREPAAEPPADDRPDDQRRVRDDHRRLRQPRAGEPLHERVQPEVGEEHGEQGVLDGAYRPVDAPAGREVHREQGRQPAGGHRPRGGETVAEFPGEGRGAWGRCGHRMQTRGWTFEGRT
ncbi:hypothetical protein [Halosegnis marinus]|uniref:hypothetical protein n=1 Tax=Halosegnis marinus TaxID=3034023 RepID=UPI003615B4C5